MSNGDTATAPSSTGWVPDSAPAQTGWVPDKPESKGWLDSATDFAKGLWSQINPISGVKGAAQLTRHPIQSYENDAQTRQEIENAASDSFKKGDYAAGMAHALYGMIPFVGPQLESTGEKFQQGKTAEALGESTGMGLSASAPAIGKAIKIPAFPETAERLYQSALKPSTALSTERVGNMVQTGLNNAIPVSDAGVEKLGSLVDDLNDKIKAQISSDPNRPINRLAVATRLGDTADTFKNQVNPAADLNAVQASGDEFMNNQPAMIPAADAQAMKTGTYQQIKKSYGQLSNATVESQKALARGLKEELSNAFPELGGLNAQESQLLGLRPALERAVRRINNQQMIGIGTPIAAGAAGALSKSTAVGTAIGILKAVFDDPVLKSKIAIGLNKQGVPFDTAWTRIGSYTDALGNASNAGQNASQQPAQ